MFSTLSTISSTLASGVSSQTHPTRKTPPQCFFDKFFFHILFLFLGDLFESWKKMSIACFVASHISKPKLVWCRELCRCILDQTEKCPVYLSWSCEPNCKNEMDTILEEVKFEFTSYVK